MAETNSSQYPKSKEKRPRRLMPWLTLILILFVVGVMTFRAVQSAQPEKPSEPSKPKKKTSKPATKTPRPVSSSKTKLEVLVGLRLRSTPELRPDNVVVVVKKGTLLEIIKKQDGWYQVRHPDGQEGYVSASSKYTREK